MNKNIEIKLLTDCEKHIPSLAKLWPERLGFSLEGTLKGNRKKPLTNEISDTIYSRYDLNNLPDLAVTWKNHNE